jgi:hypothetical protein
MGALNGDTSMHPPPSPSAFHLSVAQWIPVTKPAQLAALFDYEEVDSCFSCALRVYPTCGQTILISKTLPGPNRTKFSTRFSEM